MQPSAPPPPGGRYPASWQLPPGALPNPTEAPTQDTRGKRRDLQREGEELGKATSYDNRREQPQTVALNIFMANAGSNAILIAGRCGRWLPVEESMALSNGMRNRMLAIMQAGLPEIPKTEVVRFYTDFMAVPLARIRDQLAHDPQLMQECNVLINRVNQMEETAVQEQINQFLDRAERLAPR